MRTSVGLYINSPLLRIYDWVCSGLFNFWVWRCPTGSVLLPFFSNHITEGAHLDVAVGSGYFTAHSVDRLSKCKNVTLLDVSERALDVAEARLRAAGYSGTVDKLHQSATDSLSRPLYGKFESISLFHLLHSIPGSFPPKASQILATLVPGLAPGGVLYGATILGRHPNHTWLSRALLWLYNSKGWFDNKHDEAVYLERALKGYFEEVDVRVVGVVALFEARKPIDQSR
ncbi:S-adenosyl-L-methionine dependent methyltransferase [Fomitopsis betulina]|nr:S-adenosyl-L-methionine dependent methyltransferase [Fomitopsis betulina]